ncbi:MAG: hypothetical protein HYZ29_36220 [Myxococcales bacterium]|nr:hypothetical protein [Myxococcales bacterium]
MTPSGGHCVLTSYQWFDGHDSPADSQDPAQFFFCAPDFECFLYRFCLEDEIWFQAKHNRPMTAEQEEYLALALAARSQLQRALASRAGED